MYTYTERRDMIGYECFVGLITAKGDIYLREAGNNCERGQEPLRYGMRMSRVAQCYYHPRFTWTQAAPTPLQETTPAPSSSCPAPCSISLVTVVTVVLAALVTPASLA